MRSSFLEVAALQLAPTSPSAAAFLQSEKTRLHLVQDNSSEIGGKSRLSACQRCGFTLLPSLTESTRRNHVTKSKAKGTDRITLIYSCKTCGAKTRQKVQSRGSSRVDKDRNAGGTSELMNAIKAPVEVQTQSSNPVAKPAPARRPPSKKAKSLRAQLAASNIPRTNASSSSGPGLGLMDFLKQA